MKKYIITEQRLKDICSTRHSWDYDYVSDNLEEHKEYKLDTTIPSTFLNILEERGEFHPIRTKDNGVRNELKRIADALESSPEEHIPTFEYDHDIKVVYYRFDMEVEAESLHNLLIQLQETTGEDWTALPI